MNKSRFSAILVAGLVALASVSFAGDALAQGHGGGGHGGGFGGGGHGGGFGGGGHFGGGGMGHFGGGGMGHFGGGGGHFGGGFGGGHFGGGHFGGGRFGGFHGGHFGHFHGGHFGHHRFFGPRFSFFPRNDDFFSDDDCWQYQSVPTPTGYRLREVWVCDY